MAEQWKKIKTSIKIYRKYGTFWSRKSPVPYGNRFYTQLITIPFGSYSDLITVFVEFQNMFDRFSTGKFHDFFFYPFLALKLLVFFGNEWPLEWVVRSYIMPESVHPLSVAMTKKWARKKTVPKKMWSNSVWIENCMTQFEGPEGVHALNGSDLFLFCIVTDLYRFPFLCMQSEKTKDMEHFPERMRHTKTLNCILSSESNCISRRANEKFLLNKKKKRAKWKHFVETKYLALKRE